MKNRKHLPDIFIPPQLVEEFSSNFHEVPPKKLCRVKVNGKFVTLNKGKSAWSTVGAAKLAFRAYTYGWRNNWRYANNADKNIFVKHGLARIESVTVNRWGSDRIENNLIPFFDPQATVDDLYDILVDYMIKEKVLEFVVIDPV